MWKKNQKFKNFLLEALKEKEPEEKIKKIIKKTIDINQKDIFDFTPLMYALIHSYSENIIKLLINQKADLNLKNRYKDSSIIIAFRNGYPENIINLLIKENFDVNQKDGMGVSLIMFLFREFSEIFIKKIFYLFENASLTVDDLLNGYFEESKLDLIFELKPELDREDFLKRKN